MLLRNIEQLLDVCIFAIDKFNMLVNMKIVVSLLQPSASTFTVKG